MMDDSSISQNRRSRRSILLMTATIELSGMSLPVKLRNLSNEGALIEGDNLPVEGSEVIFRKAELTLKGRIAWVERRRAGIAFAELLSPDAVLRHIPTPRPRVKLDFRRPALVSRALTAHEKSIGEQWTAATRDRD